jgi:hypothetical protein
MTLSRRALGQQKPHTQTVKMLHVRYYLKTKAGVRRLPKTFLKSAFPHFAGKQMPLITAYNFDGCLRRLTGYFVTFDSQGRLDRSTSEGIRISGSVRAAIKADMIVTGEQHKPIPIVRKPAPRLAVIAKARTSLPREAR